MDDEEKENVQSAAIITPDNGHVCREELRFINEKMQSSMESMKSSITYLCETVRDIKSTLVAEKTPIDPRLLLPVGTELQFLELEKQMKNEDYMLSVVSSH